MAEIQYVNIGYTRKTHGLKGELKVVVEPRFEEDFLKNERIFLDVKGVKVPYFIASVRGTNEWILQLEDVESKESAFALQSRQIYLREQDLIPDHKREIEVEDDSLEYEELVGYTIEDQTLGTIGKIDEVLEMPQQEMAFLKYKNKDVLIPLNEASIVSIDKAAQVVRMDLPEGLLDM
ncbi:MAG: ribosome maturation factor RimM [Bacteroidota bacterium]